MWVILLRFPIAMSFLDKSHFQARCGREPFFVQKSRKPYIGQALRVVVPSLQGPAGDKEFLDYPIPLQTCFQQELSGGGSEEHAHCVTP